MADEISGAADNRIGHDLGVVAGHQAFDEVEQGCMKATLADAAGEMDQAVLMTG